MATAAPWQVEANGLLMGDLTDFDLVSWRPDIQPRSYDLARLLADGDFQGPQFSGPMYLHFTFDIRGVSEADLVDHVEAFTAAWPVNSPDVFTVELNLPSLGPRTCEGKTYAIDLPDYVEGSVAGFMVEGAQVVFKAGTPEWS